MRVIAQKNTDRIFRLANLPFQIGNLCVGRIEYLLRLQHIELRGDAMFHSQFGKLDGVLLCLDCALSNLKLQIKCEKQEVVTRHVTHQR